VLNRAGQTLMWMSADPHAPLLTVTLDHLSLGRAALALAEQAGTGNFTQAQTELNAAVDGLRQANQQDELPRGLLARAELWRVMKEYPKAHTDLNEALAIAEQGGMRLFVADAHLEFTRLLIAEGDRDGARGHFETAQSMVREMRYGRRFGEVEALEAALR
jgi:tetratricopeptide (TPR) repeat protein